MHATAMPLPAAQPQAHLRVHAVVACQPGQAAGTEAWLKADVEAACGSMG